MCQFAYYNFFYSVRCTSHFAFITQDGFCNFNQRKQPPSLDLIQMSDLEKNCIHIIPNYLIHIARSFCVCKPPRDPQTQGQISFRERGIQSEIKIGWRIKCTSSRVGSLSVQEKKYLPTSEYRDYACIVHFFLNRQ